MRFFPRKLGCEKLEPRQLLAADFIQYGLEVTTDYSSSPAVVTYRLIAMRVSTTWSAESSHPASNLLFNNQSNTSSFAEGEASPITAKQPTSNRNSASFSNVSSTNTNLAVEANAFSSTNTRSGSSSGAADRVPGVALQLASIERSPSTSAMQMLSQDVLQRDQFSIAKVHEGISAKNLVFQAIEDGSPSFGIAKGVSPTIADILFQEDRFSSFDSLESEPFRLARAFKGEAGKPQAMHTTNLIALSKANPSLEHFGVAEIQNTNHDQALLDSARVDTLLSTKEETASETIFEALPFLVINPAGELSIRRFGSPIENHGRDAQQLQTRLQGDKMNQQNRHSSQANSTDLEKSKRSGKDEPNELSSVEALFVAFSAAIMSVIARWRNNHSERSQYTSSPSHSANRSSPTA
jgi:hypothetical protein